jgi:hypothetical protein
LDYFAGAIRPRDPRCFGVHQAGSVGPSPPVLSSSNNLARANSKPLTINTQTGNAIVIHMLMLPGGVTAGEHSDPTVVDSGPRFKPVKVTTPTKAGLSAA